jgi:hypothetical protein
MRRVLMCMQFDVQSSMLPSTSDSGQGQRVSTRSALHSTMNEMIYQRQQGFMQRGTAGASCCGCTDWYRPGAVTAAYGLLASLLHLVFLTGASATISVGAASMRSSYCTEENKLRGCLREP